MKRNSRLASALTVLTLMILLMILLLILWSWRQNALALLPLKMSFC